jgi:hypothetical protein
VVAFSKSMTCFSVATLKVKPTDLALQFPLRLQYLGFLFSGGVRISLLSCMKPSYYLPSLGILLFLMPKAIPFYVVIAAVGVVITRNLTFGYSVALGCFPFVGWLTYHSTALVTFSIVLLLFLVVNNIPGIKKILREGWRRAILRASLKDRR